MTIDARPHFDELMARANIDGRSDSAALKQIGELIDSSGYLRRVGPV
jgi:hypothetical protein